MNSNIKYNGQGYMPCNGYVPCQPEQLRPDLLAERMEGGAGLSRRNSVKGGSAAGSRRGSADSEPAATSGLFGLQKPLKKSKPVSTVKITFMGKPMVGILQFGKAYLKFPRRIL